MDGSGSHQHGGGGDSVTAPCLHACACAGVDLGPVLKEVSGGHDGQAAELEPGRDVRLCQPLGPIFPVLLQLLVLGE